MKETKMTAKEAKELKAANLEQELEAKETEACAKEIEGILIKRNRALQFFLVTSEFGIVPSGRLVKIPEKATEPVQSTETAEKTPKEA